MSETAGKTKGHSGHKRPKDLKFYRSWCKGCGLCAAFCPTGAMAMGPDGQPVWKNPEACVGCMSCEYRCPDFAIAVIKEEADDSGK